MQVWYGGIVLQELSWLYCCYVFESFFAESYRSLLSSGSIFTCHGYWIRFVVKMEKEDWSLCCW